MNNKQKQVKNCLTMLGFSNEQIKFSMSKKMPADKSVEEMVEHAIRIIAEKQYRKGMED